MIHHSLRVVIDISRACKAALLTLSFLGYLQMLTLIIRWNHVFHYYWLGRVLQALHQQISIMMLRSIEFSHDVLVCYILVNYFVDKGIYTLLTILDNFLVNCLCTRLHLFNLMIEPINCYLHLPNLLIKLTEHSFIMGRLLSSVLEFSLLNAF